ncbi:STAS domain-containing protein [Streptomyces sp. H39-S7]|uniref:STAS domain-containing protein n=1 Tax=Streptomyces sp. H39-S7 TaxID=3004357 RepID=UPI0022B02FC9|nr:STAS domain-containing protein [Streptomyces sp. H39-S7]MCZ4119792.1 STAS domain-containing protein [Streptomyces sp. H39-S7]
MNTTEPLTITVQQSTPGRVVLALSGPCDFETVEDLRQAADEALAVASPPQCLTLDFAEVDAWDSSGLSALIWIKRCTDTDGVRLHVIGLDAHQQQILHITGLDSYLADALTVLCQDHAEDPTAATAT